MMNLRAIALLALLSGCGDCGSCGPDSKTKSEPEPSSTDTAPLESPTGAKADAGKAARDAGDMEEDGGSKSAKDAGGDAGKFDAIPVTPRPSGAPMPMGDIQSCGVYDGPLCKKDCEKGNCRQECDGVNCELNCKGGWCAQTCGAQSGSCKLLCPGGHCVQVCMKQDNCTRECPAGNCR